MAAAAVSSASPLLALLEEDDDQLKVYALKQLDSVVQHFWYQISNYIPQVEALYEDDSFDHRESAALLASKVFYYLRELDEALNYALGAGKLFDITDTSEYVQTLIARCLDKYFELRQAPAPAGGEAPPPIDRRLEDIVERMIARCCDDGQVQQAIGISLEARRLDKLEAVIRGSGDVAAALHHALEAADTVVSRAFREEVLRLVIKLYEDLPDKPAHDWVAVCQCLMVLDDADEVARIVALLLSNADERSHLLAYQIGFDLFDNDMQAFMQRVQARLDALKPAAADDAPSAADAATAAEAAPATGVVARYDKINSIISGAWPIRLHLEFHYWHNAADVQLLKNVKEAFDARVSICHSATIIANAFMHSGTTVDTFLRDNLEWLSRATNWAKFGATASLGVIHRGHLQQGKDLMAPHLPSEGRQVSPYSEGGALYALGIIHANHCHAILPFLLQSMRNSSHDVVQHGACLGIGLAALGTNNEETFEELKDVLYTDSAVGGEAAGIAMGLLCAGCETPKAKDMLAYARDTHHEKIIRGLAMGLAINSYGREEGANVMIEQLTLDQDPILRYGGMYAIGLAYRGTDNNASIQKLLHFAVSDVNDNVRRAAVLNLGFVLLGCPEQCPRIVNLLAESYNPHLRYGAAMAVGISCAGTGLKEAEALLKPMLKDRVDFVRQGALIATAMVMIQQPEASISGFRKHLEATYGDKHEDVMCKMGAIMATGIIDAGGRNATIGLVSGGGYIRRTAVIAMALFTQYWYWFPMAYMLSLTFKPTAFIGLSSDLRLPRMSLACNCKKGMFAYAKPAAESANKQVAKVPQAILSTTKKAQRRAKAKADRKAGGASGALNGTDAGGASMELDDKAASTSEPKAAAAAAAPGGKDEDMAAPAADAAGASAEAAPAGDDEQCPYVIDNPARIVPAQQKYVTFDKAARFQPLKANAKVGILILQDSRPGEPIEYVEKQTLDAGPQPTMPAAPQAPAEPAPGPQEPEAPEEFDYDG